MKKRKAVACAGGAETVAAAEVEAAAVAVLVVLAAWEELEDLAGSWAVEQKTFEPVAAVQTPLIPQVSPTVMQKH